jgi:aryl-alcohol dehydrogenase-like predicted oxidoreductase
VSAAIVGAHTVEELRADLAELAVRLDDDVLTRLDEIWPGPGEAPQTYSW